MIKTPNVQPAALLDQAIKRIDLRSEAKQLFALWPNLKLASMRLCAFLTPYVESGDRPLLDIALERAIVAALSARGSGQVSAFIQAVATITDDLCCLQISMQDRDNDWEIWDFERPILYWMETAQRECVQVRRRDTPFARGPVMLALLSRVFSIRDLMTTSLEVVA